jgi:adenylylsulfate kinase-like enzyme
MMAEDPIVLWAYGRAMARTSMMAEDPIVLWAQLLTAAGKKALAKSADADEIDRLIESVPGVGLRLNVPGTTQVIAARSCP